MAVPSNVPWIQGRVQTPVGEVARVGTTLCFADRLGAWKARWGVGRMHYHVPPGLYAVGEPTSASEVFVSANYKMSFDRLRSRLADRDGWLLILDTKGINVWCAAGKGTFGTEEIVHQVRMTRLSEVVSHHRLILPQLGAPGVRAHEVKQRSGFSVVYGPVRAEDLPAFLDAGLQATPRMRRVRFPIGDRMTMIPVELVMSAKYAIPVAAVLFLLAGLGPGVYSTERAVTIGASSVLLFLAAYLAGGALTPALLPWLPGRMFASKGAWAGLLVFALLAGVCKWVPCYLFENKTSMAAWLLVFLATASFIGMNFTGASTYTSLSGVRREIRIAAPIQASCAGAGLVLWMVGLFL